MEKIKSGCILEVAKVYKILSVLEHDKKISVGERRLLHNARQILQSEIMLIKDIDAAQAEAWIRGCC
jgi:CarD family transcriptional regulator